MSELLRGKRVAIVGGGPGGLTLARLLHLRGVDVCVYEHDASPTAREQGGALDLHEDSGQRALREAGLEARFKGVSRPEGQQSKVFDAHGNLRLEMSAEDEEVTRPEIDRGALRALLLDSLPPGTVQWGMRLTRVEDVGLRARLVFSPARDGNGEERQALADVVVGCDGAWSKVRARVSSVAPYYSGVMFVETRVTSPDARHPALGALVGPGSILALGDDRALMAQRNGDGHVRVYVALRVPEAWAASPGFSFERPAEAREGLLHRFEGWSPRLTDLLRASDDLFVPRPLYTLPPEQVWEPHPCITLLGDAAHVMPPFTGRGANYAMLDAVELADHLTSPAFGDIPAALRAFEGAMLGRMADAIRETLASQEALISPDAPDSLLAHIEGRAAGP